MKKSPVKFPPLIPPSPWPVRASSLVLQIQHKTLQTDRTWAATTAPPEDGCRLDHAVFSFPSELDAWSKLEAQTLFSLA